MTINMPIRNRKRNFNKIHSGIWITLAVLIVGVCIMDMFFDYGELSTAMIRVDATVFIFQLLYYFFKKDR
jgi:hypothetical protein